MSESKACPFCNSRNIAKAHGESGTMCRGCGSEAFGDWNTRPIEDALRAQLTAAQAEVERLNSRLEELVKLLSFKDSALNSYAEFYGRAAGLAGLSDDALPSATTDEIILRKIAEHDEIERLRAGICTAIDNFDYGDRISLVSMIAELRDLARAK